MLLDGDRSQPRENRRTGEHPLGQVRMQPNTFHLGQRERTWLVPDRVGHRQPTQIMNQRRPPDQPDVGQSHSWCGGPGQIGHSARVADG